ncbi:MAG: choline monooxygenase [Rhodospirillaceae bacterium]|nr:choline monooxygenase [Rhodospirillaceae bacterium]
MRVMNVALKAAPALTLPADWYHRADIFERERQSIFAREWQFVGNVGQLPNPGDYLATEIVGWRLFVIRDRDGELKAFHNLCRHRAGHFLEDGSGHCDVLRCKYHGWVYDTAGRLRATPAFGEAAWFDKADYPLLPIRVAVWRGLVFVNLDLEARPLEDCLGDLPELVAPYDIESFTCLNEAQFEIGCNWKTYTDNFVEGYHIPSIHAGLNSKIDFAGFETYYRDNIVVMKAPQREGSIYGGVWLWAYPNMTLSIYRDGMNTSRILPIDRQRSRLIYHFYFRHTDPAQAASRELTVETNCGIVREDFGICEIAQRNLESGAYHRGPLSPKQEEGVRYFHDRVRQSLGEA